MIFSHTLAAGGAERVTANLANYWANKRWDIAVVTLAAQKNDFYQLHPAIRRIALDMIGDSENILAGLWQNLRRVIALRRVLRQIQPDIALGIMTQANVELALATWGLRRIRAVGSEHVHPPQYPLCVTWDTLRRWSYSRLAAVAALTRETADWLKSHTTAQRVAVIPNAAPWPLPSQAPQIRPDVLCSRGRHLLLSAGRLDRQKGFDWLIECFSELAKKHVDWNLVILGDGPLRTSLEGQVRTSGLERRVFLPGLVGNVGEWYELADLYVMSSRFEGFGNTLAEALAYGVAAVSFDCDTGPRDIIRHEVDGLLVPPGDIGALTTALDRLMSDPALRRQFAGRAVEARERFSMERIAGRWEKLFDEIAE